VTISATIQRNTQPKEAEKWLRSERFYGKTARRFALPQELDESRAEAKFTDGVLELTVPKKPQAAGRKIQIN
jgi:HSP20 family protein